MSCSTTVQNSRSQLSRTAGRRSMLSFKLPRGVAFESGLLLSTHQDPSVFECLSLVWVESLTSPPVTVGLFVISFYWGRSLFSGNCWRPCVLQYITNWLSLLSQHWTRYKNIDLFIFCFLNKKCLVSWFWSVTFTSEGLVVKGNDGTTIKFKTLNYSQKCFILLWNNMAERWTAAPPTGHFYCHVFFLGGLYSSSSAGGCHGLFSLE